MYITFDRVGQGFCVYGTQGSSNLGIRYIYAEIWVLTKVYRLLCLQPILDITHYDGTDLDVFRTNRNS